MTFLSTSPLCFKIKTDVIIHNLDYSLNINIIFIGSLLRELGELKLTKKKKEGPTVIPSFFTTNPGNSPSEPSAIDFFLKQRSEDIISNCP